MTRNADTPRPILAPGATIAVVSPASPLPLEIESDLATHLHARGFQVRFGHHARKQERYLAGSDAERAEDLMNAFLDPTIDAILAARGGYGSPRILDKLDYSAIASHKKAFIGFSDITALQLALLTRSELVSYSAVNLYPDLQNDEKQNNTDLWALLKGKTISFDNLTNQQAGACEGRIIGGCLSMLVSLMGTPYCPDFSGSILVLEDVKEEPYRIDRMLTQLRLAGIFSQVAGVVLGQFTDCTAKTPADGSVEEVLTELPQWINGPVASGFGYGHIPHRSAIALGGAARLESTHEQTTLTLF